MTRSAAWRENSLKFEARILVPVFIFLYPRQRLPRQRPPVSASQRPLWRTETPPMDSQTTVKTLPSQTSFAGGNLIAWVITLVAHTCLRCMCICLSLHNTYLCLQLPTLISSIYMSHFAYACKMRGPLNLVLENWEYLWFYWTFCIVILDYDLTP